MLKNFVFYLNVPVCSILEDLFVEYGKKYYRNNVIGIVIFLLGLNEPFIYISSSCMESAMSHCHDSTVALNRQTKHWL